MPDKNKGDFEKIKQLFTEAISDCVKKHDLERDLKQIELTQKTQMENLQSAVEELTATLKSIQSENYLTRDQVLEILTEVRTDTDESKFPKIKDASTDWEVVQEKTAQGRKECEYSVQIDTRFSPRSRYVRAIDAQDSVPGAGTQVGIPINELRAGNPFAPYISVISVGNNGTFQLIDMTTMNFVAEAAHNPSRTKQGGSSARSLVVNNYVLESRVSDSAMEDVAAYRMAIEEAIMMADANIKGAQIFTELSNSAVSATAGTIQTVNTGVANGLPTVANIYGKIADIEGALPTAYRPGAVWHISRTVLTLLRKSTSGTGLNFDPERGIMMLNGYPVVPNDHCEDGDTADDISVLFGNFRRGCGMGSRVLLDVRVYEQTSPGAVTFFARTRFRPAVNDARALIGFRTAS